jgi:hemolysin activation/secretion protein
MNYITHAARAAGGCLVVALLNATPASAQTPETPASPSSTQESEESLGAPFDVLEYEIAGNTLLSVVAIERAVTPFLGPGKLLADVEAARAALEKVYQGAGYLTVFVDIPEQRITEGVVRLQVLEGRVDRLMVSGSRYYSQGYIRSKVAALSEGQVPNFNEVQRQLAIVNRSEERRVQPVLRPGQVPGTVEVELKVEDKLPVTGSIELNNQHAPDTDPWRVQASLRYENLWQHDHALGLTAITAPRETSQARVLVGSYTVPLDNGDTLVAFAVSSNSSVTTLGGTNVVGDGSTYGLRYAMPFYGLGGSAHSLTFGADYKDLSERVVFGGGSLSTPLRYMPFQAGYTGSWADRGEQMQFSTTFVFAMQPLFDRKVDCPGNVGPIDQFACKRQGADGGFATLRADLRRTDSFGWGALATRLAGQFSTQPLAASAEQFSVGGAETVRGYLEGEGSGDEGLLGSIELRSPNLGPRIAGWFGDGQPAALSEFIAHAFVDAARVRTLQPAAGQAERVPLVGTGVGLRLTSRAGISGALDLAWPRKATAATDKDDLRVHVRLGLRF